jgi:hypothetical protein
MADVDQHRVFGEVLTIKPERVFTGSAGKLAGAR